MLKKAKMLKMAEHDNVVVLCERLTSNMQLVMNGEKHTLACELDIGHKIACTFIEEGQTVVKNGMPIGKATISIKSGEHVHIHNITSAYTPIKQME